MDKINTHNKILDFGKHKGERWTRVPVNYLKWLSNEADNERGEMAKAELDRRGISLENPKLELSNHAIDRASQITKEWKEEGVASWLQNLAEEAIKEKGESKEIEYKGYKLCFALGNYYPILKTIIRK